MTTFTKQMLAASLKELMGRKTIDQITVKELVDTCGIKRQTFYYHFQDIYELLEWTYEHDFLDYVKKHVTQKDWQEDFLIIFQYIKQNRNFCLNSFFSLDKGQLESFFHRATFDMLAKVFAEYEGAGSLTELDSEFIIGFYCHAFAGVVTDWLRAGMKEEPEQIVAKLSKLMTGTFPQAIHRFSKE